MKHIEQIQPEVAAGELSGLLLADATATAALTALLHNVTGCDIPVTDDTPQSEVEELVPLAVSILRRHWQTPLTCLGSHPNGNTGVEPLDLADLFRQLIGDRVQGNESLGIPPANADIPTAVAALRERKIGCVPEAPDGVSLPHLLCDSSIADTITELIDDNIGWVIKQVVPDYFPSITRMVLGCKDIQYSPANYASLFAARANLEQIEFPELVTCELGGLGSLYKSFPKVTRLEFPKLEYLTTCNEDFLQSTTLEEFIAPNLATIKPYNIGGFLKGKPALRKLVVGQANLNRSYPGVGDLQNCPNLIHLEIGEGYSKTIYLPYWNPTTALADNLSLFLSNFRLYIADRLSDNGSGKTLTLSQEVRDAIHSAGIDTIITNKGWTISPVPTQQ